MARTSLPVLLAPNTEIENRTLAKNMADFCLQWLIEKAPNTKEARFDLEMVLLTKLTAQNMPILRFTGLYLDVNDIDQKK